MVTRGMRFRLLGAINRGPSINRVPTAEKRGKDMLSGLLGRKVGMTQVFGPNGTAIPVTVIEVGPCVVTQIKTAARDGYESVQIGCEQNTTKNVTRPELGHLGHSLPLLKAQRKAVQTYKQQQSKAKTAEGASEEGAEGEKPDKQIQKLLKVDQNRQRRPGPELGPFKVLREVDLQQAATTEKIELATKFDPSL